MHMLLTVKETRKFSMRVDPVPESALLFIICTTFFEILS